MRSDQMVRIIGHDHADAFVRETIYPVRNPNKNARHAI